MSSQIPNSSRLSLFIITLTLCTSVYAGDIYEIASDIATVIASLLAAVAIIVGYIQFHKSQKLSIQTLELQRTMYGDELYTRFAEIAAKCKLDTAPNRDSQEFWSFNALLVITESLFLHFKTDANWQITVNRMISVLRLFLTNTGIIKEAFDKDFITRITQVVPETKFVNLWESE